MSILSAVAGAERPAADSALRVWIDLRDKGPGLPAGSGRAYEDAPLHAPYLEGLRGAGFEVSTVVKWQNRASGRIRARDLAALRALDFVTRVEEMPRKLRVTRFKSRASAPLAPLQKGLAGYGGYDMVFDSLQVRQLRDALALRG